MNRVLRSLVLASNLLFLLPAEPAMAAPAHSKTAKAASKKSSKHRERSEEAPPREEKAARTDARDLKRVLARSKGSVSVGPPNQGRLLGGTRLKSSKYVSVRKNAQAFGLPALVKTIRRAAEAVGTTHGGSVLLVGDLSAKAGGPLFGHNSHQSGRDADIGFFATNSKGKAVNLREFVAFEGSGRAKTHPWARFDDARNWTLVENLVKADRSGVRVRNIFIVPELRARLLDYARKRRVKQDLIDRAAEAMMNPESGDPHDDHFHIRIGCPESMKGVCVEDSIARQSENDSPEHAGSENPGSAKQAPEDAKNDVSKEDVYDGARP